MRPKNILKVLRTDVLKRIGYSAKVSSENEIEIKLSLLFLTFLLLAFFVYFALPAFLNSINSPKALDAFLKVGAGVLSISLLREIISLEIGAFKDHISRQIKDEIYENHRKESAEIASQKYYISQIIEEPSSFNIEELNLESISSDVLHSNDKSGSDLGFSGFKDRHQIRCEILGVPDGLWKSLALSSAMHVLGCEREDVDRDPRYFFFRDIYAYLRAWLVCSIDNDGGKTMPVNVIGLHYPNNKSPDVELYLKAVVFIKDDLLQRKQMASFFSPAAMQSVKERLENLHRLIKSHF
jgi:hypothetical protein